LSALRRRVLANSFKLQLPHWPWLHLLCCSRFQRNYYSTPMPQTGRRPQHHKRTLPGQCHHCSRWYASALAAKATTSTIHRSEAATPNDAGQPLVLPKDGVIGRRCANLWVTISQPPSAFASGVGMTPQHATGSIQSSRQHKVSEPSIHRPLVCQTVPS